MKEKKIASIGVHLRRYITSHGVGINITNEVMNYFDAIDACGLGKGVTTMESMGIKGTRDDVEKNWVECLTEELEGDVYRVPGVAEFEEIWGLEKGQVLDTMIQSDLHPLYSEGSHITLK